MVRLRLLKSWKGVFSWLTPRVVLLTVIALAIVGLGYAVVRPTIVANLMNQKNKTKIEQRDKLQRETQRLENKIKWLKSPEGMNEQARRRGMLAPNEEIVRFPPQKVENTPAHSQPPATPKVEDTSLGTLLIVGLFLFLLTFLIGMSIVLYRRHKMRLHKPIGVLSTRTELTRKNKPYPVSK